MKKPSEQPLLFSFDYPPLNGGIARLCSEIVSQSSRHENVHFRVLTGRAARPWRELAAFFSLLKISSTPYSICGLWYPEGLLATLAQVRRNIILAHGAELMPPRQAWRRPLWRKLQAWVLSRADLVIANSQYTADLVRQVSPQSKVIPLPLAVDPSRFSPGSAVPARQKFHLPENQFVLGTVARLHKFKGFETVFRALAQLPEETRKSLLYVIAGTGSDRAELEALSEQLGVAEQVRWLGYVEEKDLPDFYRACDLFALCTQEKFQQRQVEGFGLVFLEAQACGVPVIGTRTGGIPDAVREGEGGWMIAPDDFSALASRIQNLTNNPQELQRQRTLARQRVLSSCSWEKYIHRLFSELRGGGLLDG